MYLIEDEDYLINTRYFTYDNPTHSGPVEPTLNLYMTVIGSYAIGRNVWDFTLHSAPVIGGTSIHDTRLYYARVTEDLVPIRFKLSPNIPVGQDSTVRTVYEYNVEDVHQSSWPTIYRFPYEWESHYSSDELAPLFCSPWTGIQSYYDDSGTSRPALLTRKEEYSYHDGEYHLKTSVDYAYDNSSHECILVGYEASRIMNHGTYGAYGTLNYDDIYHYPIYATFYTSRNPIKETRVNYHDSGSDTLVVNTTYVPRQHMTSPVRVESVSTSEEGVTRRTSYVYADTWEDAESWVSTLNLQHCLSVPLKKIMEYGVMSMPALVVNEKVVSMGKVLKAADVEKLLQNLKN